MEETPGSLHLLWSWESQSTRSCAKITWDAFDKGQRIWGLPQGSVQQLGSRPKPDVLITAYSIRPLSTIFCYT